MIPSGRYYCFVCILVNVLARIAAHQFDVDNAILYEDLTHDVTKNSRSSYFGYAVTLWNLTSPSQIFIGAPRANSSFYQGAIETGTVFKCHIGQECIEWPIGKQNVRKPEEPQDRSWLGGAMIVQRHHRKFVVCAPKWAEYSSSSPRMHGRCYEVSDKDVNNNTSAGNSLTLLYRPHDLLKTGNESINLHRLAQCGFSLHVKQLSSPRLVSGCPGVYATHGTSIIRVGSSFKVPDAVSDPGRNSDQFGYTVTSGKYFGDDEFIDVRGGPRAKDLHGQVRLFAFHQEGQRSKLKLNGTQIGEYFGAAVASCDIDGDDKDDLLVGAPQWSKNVDELGRIYIFRKGSEAEEEDYKFQTMEHIDGTIPGGKLGLTITCLGDINYDGFADVAVGAPYAGNGTVYIYYGSINGLDLDNRREIFAPKNTKGFGFSISEAIDIDDNGYPDIAIGAYLSGHVMLVRSKRIVNLTVKLSSNLPSNSGLRQNARSLELSVCSRYEGVHAPQSINVTTELKIDDVYQRATFNKEPINGLIKTIYRFNTTLIANKEKCGNYTVYTIKHALKPDLFLEPLKFSVRQSLTKDESRTGLLKVGKNFVSTNSDNFCKSCAVLNELGSPPEHQLQVPFAEECENKTFCLSILSINLSSNWSDIKPYVIHSSEFIELDVTVRNDGEKASHTKANISMPSYIELDNSVQRMCVEVEKDHKTRTVTCNITNTLDNDEMESVKVRLNVSRMPFDVEEISLNAKAITSSHDKRSGNYTASLSIKCVVKAAIGIAGASEEALYPYTLSGPAEELPNIRFQHTFGIMNDELTPITEALLSVSVPTHWIGSGDEDVEIVRLNKTMGGISKVGEDIDRKILRPETNVTSLSSNATTMSKWLSDQYSSDTEKQFVNVEGQLLAASAENRTLYMNCTNPAFKCTTVSFKLGPLELKRITATLGLTLEILFSNIKSDIIEKKDIIFFVSNASTKILQPNTLSIVNMDPVSMMVSTKFVGSPQDQHTAMWVVATSSTVGLILLVLLVLALVRLGFFKRAKKEELEALKQQSDIPPVFILETASSTEVLENADYTSNNYNQL